MAKKLINVTKLKVGGDMRKLFSKIAGLITKRVKADRQDLEEDEKLIDLSEFGVPFEDLPIDHATSMKG